MRACIAAVLACLAPVTALAGAGFDCDFAVDGAPSTATLGETETGWVFTDEGGATARFDAVAGTENHAAFHLVSSDFDPDADAVALLSVSEAGEARLAIHGFFPSFDAATLTGTCRRKEP